MSSDARMYIYFALVKLAGYLLACIFLARYYEKSSATGIRAGVARTLIGLGMGALLYAATADLRDSGMGGPAFLLILVPLRIAEWGSVFWFFFGRPFKKPVVPMLIVAICWSFVLDVIGWIFGMIASGTRIC
ncbi:MAG TPA: hypothetical protein VKT33_01455 [Candidatus Angelobacter sp.]|nr:hypothetical protein [Candidatus Angelobacter sp.]